MKCEELCGILPCFLVALETLQPVPGEGGKHLIHLAQAAQGTLTTPAPMPFAQGALSSQFPATDEMEKRPVHDLVRQLFKVPQTK